MDGSGTAFLHDPQYVSSMSSRPAGGILYFEDFDADPSRGLGVGEDDAGSPPVREWTQEDVEAARRAGQEEGMQMALADALLVQGDLQAACLQSLADALSAARVTLERTARQTAESGVRAMLAILQAAIPASMEQHAQAETDALIRALLPGLICEPELRVRTHPALADHVRETLVGLLPEDGPVLSVVADANLAQGDVQLAWRDGGARRECSAVWTAIKTALAPLCLPALEEICCGH